MTIYYTKHNAGGGGVGSEADPWTLQEAADQATAGDEVHVLNTGTYTPAQVDFDTNSGTYATLIQFIGYASDDSAPEQVTVDATGNSNGIYVNGEDYLYFQNITVTHGGICWRFMNSDFITLTQCKATNSDTNHGFYIGATNVSCYGVRFIACEAYGNTQDGLKIGSDSTYRAFGVDIFGGSYHDNGAVGIHCDDQVAAIRRCLIYDNGTYGVYFDPTHANARYHIGLLDSSVVHNNSSDGVYINSGSNNIVQISNSIIDNSGGYGINASGATTVIGFGNIIPSSGDDANTSGATNNITFVGDVLADNLTGAQIADFVDVAEGQEDFRLGSNSDAIGAGWPGILPVEWS